jgi:hemoglobin
MRIASLLLAFCLAASVASGQDKPSASLYERLGRYDGIARIADEYLKGVRADPQFARFSGRGADSLVRARQLLKDQLCALTGGPCVYIGRDMKTAHGGLAITDSDWSANMKHMAAALEKCQIAGSAKDEFLALIESLRQHIVEKDAAKH